MRNWTILIVLIAIAGFSSCGNSEEETSVDSNGTVDIDTSAKEEKLTVEDGVSGSNGAGGIQEKSYSMNSFGADKIYLGTSLEEAKSMYPEDQILDVTYLAGDEMAMLRFFDEEQFLLMEAVFDCSMDACPAVSISVLDERFRNDQGVGVGSYWGELNTVYSDFDYWQNEVGVVYLEPYEELQIFVMDLSGVPDDFLDTGIDSLPLDLPVVEVMIIE